MTQRQIIVVAVGVVIVVAAAGGGIWYWQGHKTEKQPVAQTEQADTTPSGSSLKVGSSANDLGQLNNDNRGAQGTGGSGSSTGSSVDPSTFAQYEKYKSNTAALFADIQAGSGKEAQANSKVAVTYKGWLTNGQMFDESKAGANGQLQPLVFTLGGGSLIPGFEQGVTGMKAGGSRLVIIPPSAGYGAQAQNGIPSNSVLVFQINLLDVQ
jgi:FKBP-type peptidyl-prolyl cis-trans isomerase